MRTTTIGRHRINTSRRSATLGLGAALVVLVLLVTLPPATTSWTAGLRQRLSEQIQTFEDLRLQIENDIQSMQAAMRGYLLTREPSFLETYQTIAARLPGDMAQLVELAPGVDPALEADVRELETRIVRWQAEGPERQLALIRADELAAAVAEVGSGQSQARFDAALEQLRLLAAAIGRIDSNLSATIERVRGLETLLAIGLGLAGVALGAYLVRAYNGVSRLAEQNAALFDAVSREQQRLQAVFDQSPEGILLAEAPGGAVVLANGAARRLLGDALEPGAPLAAGVLERFVGASGEPLPPAELPLTRALAGEARIGIELQLAVPGGARVPLLFNCVPLHEPGGDVAGAVAVFQDLTRFREVERLKNDFVALVSHELRTPLAAIQGSAQALVRSPKTDAARTEQFLQIIISQSERLHELIDNLLDVSQIEAGTFRLRLAPLQPGRLLRSVARQAGERFGDVSLQLELPAPLPIVAADADRVEQVLVNLLDNARKFSPPGGIITLRGEATDGAILFSVRDRGPGIPPAERERVFERFFQGAPARDGAPRGTGLGLAICRSLVEAHGGAIWVDEAVTDGTRMCFTLPRMAHETLEDQPPSVPIARSDHGAARVLVVDDEPALRHMLVNSLSAAGYVVDGVAEGQAAVEHVAAEQPDLVILDLMLPGEDGFVVLERLRDWSDVLVLILTASPEPDNVVRGLQGGADDYLTKPFSMDELFARVAALLRRAPRAEVPEPPTMFQSGPLRLDVAQRRVTVDGQPVEPTPTEFRLLAVLARHAGQVLTHTQLLQQVWGPEYEGENQYLWVHIGRLRQKIEPDPKTPMLVLTERGVGYRMASDTLAPVARNDV